MISTNGISVNFTTQRENSCNNHPGEIKPAGEYRWNKTFYKGFTKTFKNERKSPEAKEIP